MKNFKNIIILLVTVIVTFTIGCKKLEVDNLNNPDRDKALAKPADVRSIAGGALRAWFVGTRGDESSLQYALEVTADQHTCSWGNFAMQDMSWEPRKAWTNTISYIDAPCTDGIWSNMYSANSQVNDVLIKLEEGMDIGEGGADNDMIKAICYFVQGVAHGTIGAIFDQGGIVDETTDLENVELVPYTDVIDAALGYLDKAIEVLENLDAPFTLDANWINGYAAFTDADLLELCNSYAARIMVMGSRTKAQNEALDWTKVLSYAEDGLSFDFAPVGDALPYDGGVWYDLPKYYLNNTGWGRIDCRILNLMDPDYPPFYAASGLATDMPNDGAVTSADARLASDFEFLPSCNFRPERGYWHFSHYRYARFDDEGLLAGTNPLYDFRKADNDMLIAEAMARTSNLTGAIDIINAGTRVTRGMLPPVDAGATLDEVLDAIFYERDIELIDAGFAIAYTDMRRRDMLQNGTPLHFPLPAGEIAVLLLDDYTFGGAANADGINTASGGWIEDGVFNGNYTYPDY